ncbi:unnamed protein product [Brassicogethes aeneus]|uniref:protein-glutamine gamma-glutamyltransferase n=1 Tax=Brassicogethes aeneus TaxID=1431903 RepID=A0A9P0B6R9_BRAAE|nr:unnamed protein product [Brassicogethes aeneus]
MGRFGDNCCHGFSRFRANWVLNHDESAEMQSLPKPKEYEETDLGEANKIEEEPDILIIRNINPCISRNGTDHHTEKFDLMTREIDPQLVVRRGQPFYLNITLSREYNPEKDAVSFVFTLDGVEYASHGNGTMVAIPLLKQKEKLYSWNVILFSSKENIITVEISTSANSVVGKWLMEIDTKIKDNGAYSYAWETKIYLLFNPWCKNDQVYLANGDWREETVENDVGLMWRGTYNSLRPVIWRYDQFEKDILECSLYLLKIGKVKISSRNDPVQTTRGLSAAVNSYDDNGAVEGNWSIDHSGGTPPAKWLGSRKILQQYYKKKSPVKYGQCWVFSGVLTTICRALGIPTRPVTCYSSAHDTQNSLTVDYFIDEKGNTLEGLNSDSIWNYHVWNEVWMQRPDLGKEYNGWQAIDATPQELSDNMYRIGPASVHAVKLGEVLKPYDNSFLFSEVNADKILWKYCGPTQPLKLIRKDMNGIGKLICTKSAGAYEREDLTNTYKFPEKSTEERSTMLKALRQSENLFSRYYLNEDFNDIHFNFKLIDDIKIGQPFDVALSMKNRSKSTDYKVKVMLKVTTVTYMGTQWDTVKQENFEVTVKADTTHEVTLTVTFDEYHRKLIEDCAFSISSLATIEDTKFEYFAQDDFRIRKPDIKIVLQDTPVEEKECKADIYLENPLPIPLKNCKFIVEGPGIKGALKLKVKDTVPPGKKAHSEFTFTPTLPGRFTIAAKFESKQLNDVDGYQIIEVEAMSNEIS